MDSTSQELNDTYEDVLEKLMSQWRQQLVQLHETWAHDGKMQSSLASCEYGQLHAPISSPSSLRRLSERSTDGALGNAASNDTVSSPAASHASCASSDALQTLLVRPGYELFSKKLTRLRSSQSNASLAGAELEISLTDRSERTENGVTDKSCSERSRWQASVARMTWSWNPESRSRSIYEAATLFMLSYDGILVPFFLAWDISENELGVWTLCTWLARLFWSFDLISNFFVAYRNTDARLETKLSLTARNYLQGGFAFDFLLVSLDWAGVLSTTGRVLLFVRALRLVRGLRQILRALGLYNRWRMTIAAKENQMASDITLLLVLMMLLNHGIACAFWAVTFYADADTGGSWLMYSNFVPGTSVTYEYTTSLHWAVTQFSPGSMEINPKNSSERIFAIGILILALVLASSFVATIASMVTAYRVSKEEATRKYFQLQTYLKQHHVRPELAIVVHLQVQTKLKEIFMLKTSEVQHLKLLSQTVRDELQFEINARRLGQHTFFASLWLLDEFAIRRICVGLGQRACSHGDTIFDEGRVGDRVLFLTHGNLRYSNIEGDALNVENVPEGTWLAEPALWTLWVHMGTAESIGSSELVYLAADELQTAMQRFPATSHVIADYCSAFHGFLLQPGVKLSDLPGVIDYQELMLWIPARSRDALLDCIFTKLEDMTASRGGRVKPFELLREEMNQGKCSLGLVDQEPVRTVFLVAVELEETGAIEEILKRGHKRFLVQVGQLQPGGEVKATSPMLPAIKRKREDDTFDLVRLVLKKELEEIADNVLVEWKRGFAYSSFIKDSPTYGIRTRYLRTKVRAKLTSGTKLNTANIKRPWDAAHEASRARKSATRSPFTFRYRQERQHLVGAADVLGQHSGVVVVATPEDDKCTAKLYIWLSQADFEVLSLDSTKSVVSSWVESIDPAACKAAATASLNDRHSFIMGTVSEQFDIAMSI